MDRPAIITSPIPTLDEVARSLGIGKARRESIIRIMTGGKTGLVQRKAKSAKPSAGRDAKGRFVSKIDGKGKKIRKIA